MSLGPNALVPCPSDSCRRRNLSHGRICPVCEPTEEWPARCPICRDTVAAVGQAVLPHQVGGRGYGFGAMECPGSGLPVAAPVLVVRPIWSPGRAA